MQQQKKQLLANKKVPDIKRVAILAQNSLFPKANADSLKHAAKKARLEIVYDSLYASGTTDLINVLAEIKLKKPDWVYVFGYTLDLILARRQMLDVGLDAKVISMTVGPVFAEFPHNLKDKANGVTSNSWWVGAVPYKDAFMFGSASNYAATFEAKYKKEPTYLEAAASVACEVLVQSIERLERYSLSKSVRRCEKRRSARFMVRLSLAPMARTIRASC